MTTLHSTLTGNQLHEPKGVENATAGQAYIADGAGSGTWQDPLTSLNNVNEFEANGTIADISTLGSSFYYRVGRDCTLTNVYAVMDGAITGADAVVSFYRDGVLLGQSMTVEVAGSGDGVKKTVNFGPTYDFTQGQVLSLEITTASTNPVKLYATLLFTAN